MRGVLATYLQNVDRIVDELGPLEQDAGEGDDALTDEEQEELAARRQEERDQREKKILEDAFFRSFRSWSERDWRKFENSYFDFAG